MALRVVEPVEETADDVCAFPTSALDAVATLVEDRLAGVDDEVPEAGRVGSREPAADVHPNLTGHGYTARAPDPP